MRTVLDDLHDDWTRLADSATLRESLRRWGLDVRNGHEVIGVTQSGGYAAADEVLHALLVAAATDRLAGQVVLTLLTPSLRATANRCRTVPVDEAAAIVVAMAWEEITRYVRRSRPPYVLATITRAIRKRVVRHVTRPTAETTALDGACVPSPTDPYDSIDAWDALADAQRRTGISTGTMRVLMAHRGYGQPLAAIADADGVNPAALRQRASRAEQRLRKVARSHDDPAMASSEAALAPVVCGGFTQ